MAERLAPEQVPLRVTSRPERPRGRVRRWFARTLALLVALAAGSSAQVADDIRVTQTAPGYVAGTPLAVTCEIAFDAGRQVQSLLWMPALPSGWTLEGTATGDGS